jgi:hypothetical protein
MVDRSSGKQGGRAGGAGVQSGVPQTYPPALLTHRMLKAISVRPEGAPPGVAADAGYQVANSCRFNDDDSPNLTRTPGSASNRDVWTISVWVKPANVFATAKIFQAGTASNFTHIYFSHASATDSNLEIVQKTSSAYNFDVYSTAQLRDPHAWYHIVVRYDSSAPSLTAWINNRQVTFIERSSRGTAPTAGLDSHVNNNVAHYIGSAHSGGHWDGYMSEFVLIDGTALTPSSFAETDDNGVWRPISVSGLTFGTNGFYLDFKDSSALGNDVSGNNNDYSSSGLASTDQMVDTPTNNYCTFSILNPLTTSSADGALDWVSSTDGANSHGTIFFDSTDATGFYWEYTPVDAPSKTASSWMIGIMDIDGVAAGVKNDATYAGSYQIRCGDGGIQGGGGSVIANGTWDSGGNGGISLADTVQVVVKAGKMYFGVNNVWYDSSDDSFANAGEAFTGITGFYTPTAMFGGTTSATHRLNCGNNGSYVRTKPTGLKDISTSNLTAPAIKDPGVHAHIELVDHGGTSTAFTLPWDAGVYDTYFIIKNIDNSEGFYHVDTVRGTSAIIKSGEASPAAESTDSNVISVSGTTITLGSTLLTDLYHVECHKAGLIAGRETGDGAGNLSRTLSFNADSGFAIAAFTGEAGSGDTLDIGLSKPTERMWIKDRAGADAPLVYIKGGGATKAHDPDTTSALSTSTTYWNDTAPTTGIITLGSSNQTNGANTMVCWAWHSSDVYKIGTYEGNGSTDGPVIYLDDAPLQVEVKRHDGTGSMNFQDAKRDPGNPRTLNLAYDTPAADLSDYHRDFLANGFKPRSSSDYINASGSNYTYFAIIEHNFGGDGATPATAR